jgi:kynureninase
VTPIERALANLPQVLDEASLARHVRPLFSRALQREEIYLANHSLGRPLDQTLEDVREALELWYGSMDGAWEAWLAEMAAFRAAVAALIGAPRADCIVPKTSAGQGLRAVLNSYERPVRVVTTAGEFDSLDFILKHYRESGRIELAIVSADARGEFQVNDVLREAGDGTALVVLSMVMFETGQILGDLPRLAAAVHARGGKVLVDVYHAAGAIPVDVEALDADFAIGGSYKYLRGGPGASWLYVHPRHLDAGFRTLDTGWFAKPERFTFVRGRTPQFAPGGDALLESTPAVLSFFQARAGLKLTAVIGVDRLRAYSLERQAILVEALARENVQAVGARPDRGAFVVVTHPRAADLARALRETKIVADGRRMYLRLGPDLLTTRGELEHAARALARLLK